jgi:thiol peroxidase
MNKEIIMNERSGIVTAGGNPMTLQGNEIKVGDKAPDFEVINTDSKAVHLSAFKGKIVVIASVPSLDTAVCDAETRRFNLEAEKLSDDVQILTISMDLPAAQKRWCGAAGVKRVQTLSDHRTASFGTSYGVLIKELRLLARVVFVIDRDGTVRYIQVVNEVSKEPVYDEIIEAINKLK